MQISIHSAGDFWWHCSREREKSFFKNSFSSFGPGMFDVSERRSSNVSIYSFSVYWKYWALLLSDGRRSVRYTPLLPPFVGYPARQYPSRRHLSLLPNLDQTIDPFCHVLIGQRRSCIGRGEGRGISHGRRGIR